MSRSHIFAGLLAITVSGPSRSQVIDPTPDIVRRASGAVVTLTAYDGSGEARGQGSGFLIPDGRIVTNVHVVSGASRIEVLSASGRLLGAVDHVSNLSVAADLAILPRLGDAPAGLELAVAEPPVGQRVLAIGAPQGLESTVSDGLVSAYRTLDGTRLMQVSAPISQGSSGGPILDLSGRVVGVAVGIYRTGQNLNFAVPLDQLRALVASPAGRLALPAQGDGPANAQAPPAPRRVGRRPPGTRAAASAAEPDEEGPPLPVLSINGSVSGRIEGSDDFSEEYGVYEDYMILRGAAGTSVRISLETQGFRGVIAAGRVAGDDIEWFVADNGERSGGQPQVRAVIPSAGALAVRILGREASSRGAYVVTAARDVAGATQSRSGNRDDGVWRYLGVAGTRRHYVDTSRIRRLGGARIEAWVRRDGENRTAAGRAYDRSLHRSYFDCAAGQIGILQSVFYQGPRVVESFTYRTNEISAVVPGSIGEEELEVACQVAGLR